MYLQVNWHTVFWGIALQYVFALVILRTKWGYDVFKWLGDRVTEFLEYTMAGVVFVFGEAWSEHFFAMKVFKVTTSFRILTLKKQQVLVNIEIRN